MKKQYLEKLALSFDEIIEGISSYPLKEKAVELYDTYAPDAVKGTVNEIPGVLSDYSKKIEDSIPLKYRMEWHPRSWSDDREIDWMHKGQGPNASRTRKIHDAVLGTVNEIPGVLSDYSKALRDSYKSITNAPGSSLAATLRMNRLSRKFHDGVDINGIRDGIPLVTDLIFNRGFATPRDVVHAGRVMREGVEKAKGIPEALKGFLQID